ncbi:DUF4418 family protein [Selenomonas sp. oral taxon 138]|uniref:DUF4418 family protein n=1 Tax=Selenomonas sp. oral taxon 138 TaxID=712532 RepID=UPI0002A1BEDE|nr:DUF4418 family protein [Selenomonas sp. oral taxon 138]EKX99272.1 hypothetical protein HMPREF9163_00731 [Selenomonas sp. oral taxon 138 str. F0429]
MNEKKRRWGITDILLLVLNLIFFVGIQTVFVPCEARPDGSWMTCHWAGQALIGIAAVLVVIALMHLVIPRTQVKIGLSLAVIPVSVLAFAVPDHLIDLCMMETMHCHTVMEPAVTILSLLNVLLAAADIYVYQKGENG